MPLTVQEGNARAIHGQRRFNRTLVDAFLVLFLATIASTFHRVAATVLVQTLAMQGGGGEEAAARWTTATLVASALSSAIALPLFSIRASTWGHKTLFGLALLTAGLYEMAWYGVATASQADQGVSAGKLASVLVLSNMMAGLLGGDQLVSVLAVMLALDQSPDKDRAQNLNLVQAVDLLGNLCGPLLTSLILSRRDKGDGAGVGIYFLLGAAWYLLALVYLVTCFRKVPTCTAHKHSEGRLGQSPETKTLSFRDVLCLQPPDGARLRPLPIVKILVSAIFASDGASVMSYLQLSVDNQFGWSTRENSFLLAFIAGARFLAIFFFVPLFFSLARGRPNPIDDHQGETSPLLPALEQTVALSPRQNPGLRVAQWSYLLSCTGWLLIAVSTLAHTVVALFVGLAVLALGIGANPAIHAYATHLLKTVEQVGAVVDNTGDQQRERGRSGSIAETSSSPRPVRSSLEVYLGLLYSTQNAISVLSPLLDNYFYVASLRYCKGNPSLLFSWAALQYFFCAALVRFL